MAVQLHDAPALAHDDRPREDHTVVLRGATWADYQRLLAIRGDRSAPRIAYLEGSLEIMSPSRPHEGLKSLLGRLVEVFCLHHGTVFRTLGSWTLEDKALDRGAEPDECYIFGQEDADRPHLAIEVVWTSGGLNKLLIYRKLGVPEVWFWRRGRLEAHTCSHPRLERGLRRCACGRRRRWRRRRRCRWVALLITTTTRGTIIVRLPP